MRWSNSDAMGKPKRATQGALRRSRGAADVAHAQNSKLVPHLFAHRGYLADKWDRIFARPAGAARLSKANFAGTKQGTPRRFPVTFRLSRCALRLTVGVYFVEPASPPTFQIWDGTDEFGSITAQHKSRSGSAESKSAMKTGLRIGRNLAGISSYLPLSPTHDFRSS
jgi:hypothetical protein